MKNFKNKLISIIVVNYNNSKFINKCIISLKKQSYKNIEIIFVDNQSLDNSIKKIKSYKNIKLIINKRKTAFGSYNQIDSYYQGFLKSKGQIIFFLDSDDYFKKNKIKKIVTKFNNNKNYQLLFDLPIYMYGSQKKYYKFTQKNFLLSNWPRFSPQSCISIKRDYAKEIFKKVFIKSFPDIWFDFRIAIYSFLKFGSLHFVDEYLTIYRKSKNSATAKFSKFNKNWWIRRKQAFDCFDYFCKKNNKLNRFTLDKFITKFINLFLN